MVYYCMKIIRQKLVYVPNALKIALHALMTPKFVHLVIQDLVKFWIKIMKIQDNVHHVVKIVNTVI